MKRRDFLKLIPALSMLPMIGAHLRPEMNYLDEFTIQRNYRSSSDLKNIGRIYSREAIRRETICDIMPMLRLTGKNESNRSIIGYIKNTPSFRCDPGGWTVGLSFTFGHWSSEIFGELV